MVGVYDETLLKVISVAVRVSVARRRNPGGVFTRADSLFESAERTDRWMAEELWFLKNRRPVDLLEDKEGLILVLDTLSRIAYGVYA